MREYKDIPTTEAASLAVRFAKAAVLIVAIDDEHNRFQFTTYGTDANAKVRAARLSEEFSKFLGCDQGDKVSFEDFREPMEAARVKEQRDTLLAVLEALANKVDATSDCDHKRASCKDVGCIGHEVKIARELITKARTPCP